MKHIYVYLNPRKSFNEVSEALFKVQVDNLAVLGVNPADIILATNFPYEYKEVKATIFGDHNIQKHSTACKAAVLFEMFKEGMIENKIYWMKDLDTFQVRFVTDDEIGLDGYEVGLTTYGYLDKNGKDRWNTGSLFVTDKCGPFADAMFGSVHYYKTNEEVGISKYIKDRAQNGKIWNIKIKKLSRAYNVGFRGFEWDIEGIKKPLAALHFPLTPEFFKRMKPYMNEELPGIITAHFPNMIE